MGVTGLFPFIRDNFEEFIIYFPNGSRRDPYGRFDYIHIDGNAMIHPAAQIAFQYDKGANVGRDPFVNMTYEERRTKSFEIFWRGVVCIVENFGTVNCTLVLTLDGPAPLAKQTQQRERRFQAIYGKEVVEKEERKFSSTQISPGTIYTLELTKYLHFQIRKYLNGPWSKRNIYFSSTQVPGEGEHKIMDFIRDLSLDSQRKKHLMVGPDGDLIFLTLGVNIPQMFLLREEQRKDEITNCSYIIAISQIARELPYLFKRPKTEPLIQSVDDFILSGFFVGNDFLPIIQMFDSLRDGINIMVDILIRKNLRITKNGNIDFPSFYKFIEGLAREEPSVLLDFALKLKEDPQKQMLRNLTLENFIVKGKLNFEGFRRAYLQKSGIDPDQQDQIDRQCLAYMKTIQFITQYYINGLPSWEWYYPYHYAPLMVDLASFCNRITKKQEISIQTIEMGEPSRPFVQLLCILPSGAADILPPAYRHLMLSSDSALVKAGYYPKEYKLDYEGKPAEHLAAVLLKQIDDISLVREEYQKVSERDPNRYARNELGDNYMYHCDKDSTPYRYESGLPIIYGNIEKCYVVVRKD